MSDPIEVYSSSLSDSQRGICQILRAMIDRELPNANAKLWHGSPVWFDVLGDHENPIVSYSSTKKGIELMFWNGQTIDPELIPVGKVKAGKLLIASSQDLNSAHIRNLLTLARDNVFDSVEFFRKKQKA